MGLDNVDEVDSAVALKEKIITPLGVPYSLLRGPDKVRNETKTKRNVTEPIETKRNRSKRNETNRNETEPIETKRNKTKRNQAETKRNQRNETKPTETKRNQI